MAVRGIYLVVGENMKFEPYEYVCRANPIIFLTKKLLAQFHCRQHTKNIKNQTIILDCMAAVRGIEPLFRE